MFIFQIDEALTTASNSSVVFINGSSPCNVFWKIGSSATLGTGTHFVGNIMALTSIAMQTGATLQGRALARNGAVTLDTNVITTPVCTTTTPTPATTTAGPTLPTTGSRGVPMLVGTGAVLVVLGGIILVLYRRRTRQI